MQRTFAILSVLIIGAFIFTPALINIGHARHDIDRGEMQYAIQCQNCHALPQFDAMNSVEWNRFLEDHVIDKNIPKEYWDEIVLYIRSTR